MSLVAASGSRFVLRPASCGLAGVYGAVPIAARGVVPGGGLWELSGRFLRAFCKIKSTSDSFRTELKLQRKPERIKSLPSVRAGKRIVPTLVSCDFGQQAPGAALTADPNGADEAGSWGGSAFQGGVLGLSPSFSTSGPDLGDGGDSCGAGGDTACGAERSPADLRQTGRTDQQPPRGTHRLSPRISARRQPSLGTRGGDREGRLQSLRGQLCPARRRPAAFLAPPRLVLREAEGLEQGCGEWAGPEQGKGAAWLSLSALDGWDLAGRGVQALGVQPCRG